MKLISCAALLLMAVLPAIYAANTGAIKGFVKDTSGAFVPGASLTLRSGETDATIKVDAGVDGYFQFLQLPPGSYSLTAQAKGFRKAEIKNITVLLDQIISYDVSLEVGQITEIVEVTGGVSALIEPEKTSTTANITPSMVKSLPTSNRTFDSFWLLTPGASQAAAGSQSGGTTISAAGARSGSMNQLIDGINNTDRQFGGPINKFRIADAVQEFSVTTTVAPAELGRQSGPQVNVITKSGTNQFHGGAFWFLRNDALEARNFFTNKLNAPKRKLRQNQFGGTIGGPIRKDKTFFFYSWESQHLNNPAAATSAVVPTQAERDSVVDPVAKKLVQYFPLPNVAGAAPGTANFVANAPSTNTDNTHMVRVDHSLTEKDRLTGRYLWYGGKAFSAGALLSTGGTNSSPGAQSVVFADTHTWSPTFITELRAGFSRDVTFILPQDYGVNAATILPGVPGVYDSSVSGPLESGLPSVSITGYSTIGRGGTSTPQELFVNTYDLLLNNTKSSPFGWARHTFRFGGDIRREEVKRLNDGGASGTVTFNSFANFAGTCTTCAGQSLLNTSSILVGTSLSYWYRYPWALYFQDDIKLTRNLTLNIGLRYEYPSAVIEKRDRATNFIDGLGPVLVGTNKLLDVDPTKTGVASLIYRQAPFTVPRAGTTTDKNNFAPIFGFAYTPQASRGPAFLTDGKTVLRGGFRATYDETYNNVTVNQSINAPWNLTTSQQAGVTQPAAGYGWGLAFNQNIPFVVRTTQAPGAPAIGLLSFNGLSYNAPTAYAYNWNLGVQRQLSARASLDVSYLGSAGHKFGEYVNTNQPSVIIRDPGFRGSQAPNEQIYPFQRLGKPRTADFQGNSIYGGLVITGKIRASSLLDMVTSYTWSHSIDNGSSFAGTTGDVSQPDNRYQMNLERGNSTNDQRHRFMNYFTFQLPFGSGKRFLSRAHGVTEQLLGGWQISGIATIYTGQPFTVYANRNVDFSGFNTLVDRPDIIGSGPLAMNYSNPDQLFDPAYFGKVGTNICPGYSVASGVRVTSGCAPAGRVGTSPRDAYYGPGAINFDTTMGKRFALKGERLGMTYRADFFNLMNHTNFTSVQATMSSGQFGQMTAAAPARVIQMTLRLDF